MNDLERFGFIHLEEVDSTNNYVREAAASRFPDGEFVVVSADYQTAGRGQRGNTWVSERGKDLLFSMLCHPVWLDAGRQFVLSQAVALSIREEVASCAEAAGASGGDFSIKWPNDIYWREQKLGGILIENDLEGKHIATSIIGVGLNLNRADAGSYGPNAVSLRQITGKETEPTSLLRKILRRFEGYYRRIEQGEHTSVAERYKAVLFWREGFHPYMDLNRGEAVKARIHHIGEDGRLTLEDAESRLRTYAFKEVAALVVAPDRHCVR